MPPGSRYTLRHLEYFVTVADEGTMAAAADRHQISQSAVSLAINDLERALDVQLFLRRKARGVVLTGIGRQILPEARRMLEHAAELQATATALGHGVGGDLALGCYPTLTPFLVPRILSELPRRHPAVSVNLVEAPVAEMLDRLADGAVEAALMYDLGIGPEFSKVVLYDVRPYVLLPTSHRLASSAAPVSLRELDGEPMVMLDMPPSETMFRRVLAAGGVEPHVRFSSASFESVRSLVASGAGYSLLLQRPAPTSTYAGPPLVYRDIEEEVPAVDVVLVQSRHARRTRRVAAFTEFCQDTFATRHQGRAAI